MKTNPLYQQKTPKPAAKKREKMIIANNKKAYYDFFILEKIEVGIELLGSEVKALRASRANLKDSFVKVIRNELFLFNAHIGSLSTTHTYYKPDERRSRRLLAHKRQIHKLLGATSTDGRTIVPLCLYFNLKNRVKLEIALAEGKALHDKRNAIKERIANREARAALKNY